MARPLVRFADATLLVQQFIKSRVDVPVYPNVPNPRPKTFVTVKRLGGMRNSMITDRPRVDIHCWAPTEAAAVDLMTEVRAHVHSMGGQRGDYTVYRVREASGPQWMPDSESGHPRYAFAVEFSARGLGTE